MPRFASPVRPLERGLSILEIVKYIVYDSVLYYTKVGSARPPQQSVPGAASTRKTGLFPSWEV